MDFATTFLVLAVIFGLFMAWGIGANDVANAMGASVGSKALTIKQAIIIAVVFEVAGAILAGGEVTNTIRGGIIEPQSFTDTPELLVYGMLASLLAAGTWLMIASYFGWPVSTTHSIVGAIIGFGAITLGVEAVNWSVVTGIFLSWIVTPVISGVIAYLIFVSIQKHILSRRNPVTQAKKLLPIYIFFMVAVVGMATLIKGLKHIGLPLTFFESITLSILFAGIIAIISGIIIRKSHYTGNGHLNADYANVEKIFGILMIITAMSMAFAHGSNDVANAIGPVAAVFSIVKMDGQIVKEASVTLSLLILGGVGIMIGLVTFGYRTMQTIGTNITDLTPSRGFAACLAASSTVVIASGLGLPISTTQTLVGAILGVGIARGIAALNLNVIRNIFMSWIITLPAGAVFAVIYFYVLKGSFTVLG